MTKHCKYCEEYVGDRTDGFCSDICSKLYSRDAPMPNSDAGMIREAGDFAEKQTAQKAERIKHVIKEHINARGVLEISAEALSERFGVAVSVILKMAHTLGAKVPLGKQGAFGGPCDTYGVHQS